MPRLSKKVLSQFVRTRCSRQLRLNLSPDTADYRDERINQDMPPRQRPRPGLEIITQAGEEWEAAKLGEMRRLFEPTWIIGTEIEGDDGVLQFRGTPLSTVIGTAPVGTFLIRPRFEVLPEGATRSTFTDANGLTETVATFGLDMAGLEPDLIQVRAARASDKAVDAAGNTRPLPASDIRRRLRVLDIKLTAEANAGYFTEITFYSMALAAWLVDNGLDHSHVVIADAAIWPGSHDASAIAQYAKAQETRGETATHQGLVDALERDLETVPFEVFAFRIRKMLRSDLNNALSHSWRDLSWHVDNRCSGCDYLGYAWMSGGELTNHKAHCMPQAEREGQLSRIAFVTQGCRSSLEQQGVRDVTALAGLNGAERIFEAHQTLKATRALIPPRAVALVEGTANLPPRAGSGVMPRWADLRICITCEFDIGSGISLAFGLSGFWFERRDFGSLDTSQKQSKPWKPIVRIVPERSVAAEREHFLAFLGELNSVMSDPVVAANAPGLQIYIWDRLTFQHLCKVVGRHLDAILASPKGLAQLAWLFPSDDIVPNAEYSDSSSPITIVQDVVRAVLAAPVAHYYNLIEIARVYHDASLPEEVAKFSLHPMFYDEFSDHVPSERAHEIWTRSTKPNFYWTKQISRLEETIGKRLRALDTVVRRLQDDLKAVLVKNPAALPIKPPKRHGSISVDGELWFAFHKLNAALDQLEVAQTRAMPPHEREARHKSARLDRRLDGNEETEALAQLGLGSAPGRRVYRMRPGSKQVKARQGDFNFALSPELRPRFPDESLAYLCRNTQLTPSGRETRWRMADATKVTVAAIDRGRDLIALDAGNGAWLDQIEAHGIADLSRNVVMDPIYNDLFVEKLDFALRGLGNPPSAVTNSNVSRAVGAFLWPRPPKRTAQVPAADFVWDAAATHGTRCARDVVLARSSLDTRGTRLNESQWQALDDGLSRRLHLIWGPPGTGKSRTLRAAVVGAVLEALATGRRLRILLTAFTWSAIDNLLLDALEELTALLSEGQIHRLLSPWSDGTGVPVTARPFITKVDGASSRLSEMLTLLRATDSIVLCASTVDQVRNVLKVANSPRESLFDLMIIDEASQMDVAHAIVGLSAVAEGAGLVLAGDPLQLAPIHKAEPPLGLESIVGSVYAFFRTHHQVDQTMLAVNYRSNATIVEFVRTAGYGEDLIAHSPDLRLRLLEPVPSRKPANWAANMWWTPDYAEILDPAKSMIAFVYPEGVSSQWNEFEADTVAALVKLLHGRLADGLDSELDVDGSPKPLSQAPYDGEGFWTKGVGIVTPHRAQQGLVVAKLAAAFGATGDDEKQIRDAVDTVERFQGQQRDVIIATFALSDPDSIADEDEFLFNLNRFNVMASRARAKLIVLVSQEIVDHLATDVETMHASRLIKTFVESYCNVERAVSLGHLQDGSERTLPGSMRWHR